MLERPASHLTREAVRVRVASLIGEITGIDASSITERSGFDSELRMESVAFVELQVAIEEEYDIELDPIELVERGYFGPIVDYIFSRTLLVGE